MVSIGIMNTQINVRFPVKLLAKASSYAEHQGYGNVQELIKESLREKVFEEQAVTKEEFMLIKKLAELTKNKNLYGTEEELFKKLRKY